MAENETPPKFWGLGQDFFSNYYAEGAKLGSRYIDAAAEYMISAGNSNAEYLRHGDLNEWVRHQGDAARAYWRVYGGDESGA